MPDYLDYYLKATIVNIGPGYSAPERKLQCFIVKLIEMYIMNDSTEDLAAAVIELLELFRVRFNATINEKTCTVAIHLCFIKNNDSVKNNKAAELPPPSPKRCQVARCA